ncbi:MAG: pyridoxal phosphate-dependent aminotransferase [Blautia sp.]|nr:pyridoxal phosphate-dependent aminotransferase [Blautia sp.]
MSYDFDKEVNRRDTGSLKWDVPKWELPMWVADMDFETVPAVTEALIERAQHGVFGYSTLPDAWAESYVDWWRRRHGFTIEAEWLIFTTGIVPAISSAVRKLTTPAENVVVQTPSYNIFFNSIRNNGRNIVENRLLFEGGEYRMDFKALEKQLADPQTSLMILCNPQNPVGKIWDKETLARVGELCANYHVTVLSDEIHCDLTAPGKAYVPFASVNEVCKMNSVVCIAPTKAFNLAGLQTAAVYAADPLLRHRMWRQLNTDEVAEPNAFAVDAAVAVFTHGEEWLTELREYIWENKAYVTEFLRERVPEIRPVASDATYLMWLDCRNIVEDSDDFYRFLREDSGLYLASGKEYGNGQGFMRLNVATRRALVEDGMERLERSVQMWKK